MDNRDFIRKLSSYIINFLANIVLELMVLDYTTGFVLAKKQVFKNVSFDSAGHGEYCIEFLYKAKKQGFKLKEILYD